MFLDDRRNYILHLLLILFLWLHQNFFFLVFCFLVNEETCQCILKLKKTTFVDLSLFQQPFSRQSQHLLKRRKVVRCSVWYVNLILFSKITVKVTDSGTSTFTRFTWFYTLFTTIIVRNVTFIFIVQFFTNVLSFDSWIINTFKYHITANKLIHWKEMLHWALIFKIDIQGYVTVLLYIDESIYISASVLNSIIILMAVSTLFLSEKNLDPDTFH